MEECLPLFSGAGYLWLVQFLSLGLGNKKAGYGIGINKLKSSSHNEMKKEYVS